MATPSHLFELSTGEVIVIHPPVYSDFDLFISLYLKAFNWYQSSDQLCPYLKNLLILIVDIRFPLPELKIEDIVNLLLYIEKNFLSVESLPELPKSSTSFPKIIPTSSEEANLLGNILYSYKELGMRLYKECDRQTFYQILNQLSQYSHWESEMIKNGDQKEDSGVLPLVGENREILEQALRERASIRYDERDLGDDFAGWQF